MFPNETFDIVAFISRNCCGRVGFDRSGSWLSLNEGNFTENCARIHQHVEQVVIFIDVNRAFLEDVKSIIFLALFDNGRSRAKLFSRLHYLIKRQ